MPWGLTTRLLADEKTQSLGSGVGVAEIAASSLPTRVLSVIPLHTRSDKVRTDNFVGEMIKVLKVHKLTHDMKEAQRAHQVILVVACEQAILVQRKS